MVVGRGGVFISSSRGQGIGELPFDPDALGLAGELRLIKYQPLRGS